MSIETIIQLVINGLLLGGFYASMSLGFSIIWGVMRLINLAHGEFLLMGAFTAWFFFNPTRVQSLDITSNDPTITLAVILFLGIVLGYLSTKLPLLQEKIPHRLTRLGLGMGGGLVIAFLLFTLWQQTEFNAIPIRVAQIVQVGFFLSFGFMISHVLLGTFMGVEGIWRRRSIGYGTSLVVTLLTFGLWQASGLNSIDPFLVLPVVFILFFGLGYAIQRSFLNYLVEGPYLTMLLVTFAMAIILQNIGLAIYAADPRSINIKYGNAINVFSTSITLPPAKLVTVILSVFLVIGLIIFLRYTRVGYAIRAAAQHKMAARLMGINIHETYALTFATCIAITAVSGGMMGTFQPITPITGAAWTLRAFAIVALGGLGKVEGVVIGGLVLGVTESLVGGFIGIGWGVTVSFVLLVVMLVVRPQGLSGGLVPEED